MSHVIREIRYVEWVDSAAQTDWQSLDETVKNHGVSRCVTVGFVLVEDDEQVMLAGSIDARYGNVGDVIAIPKVAVTKATTLRKGR